MTLIPLLSYRWVEQAAGAYSGIRPENFEDRWKYWTAFKWFAGDGSSIRTTEVRFVVEPMPDFCGGFLITSPQVLTHQSGSWGQRGFLPQEGSNLDLAWNVIEGDTDRILDLAAITGKSNWTQAEVEAYAYECMAHSIAGEMISRGKAQFMASDCVGGRMTQLCKFLSDMGTFVGRTGNVSSYAKIDDRAEAGSRDGPLRRTAWRTRCESTLSTAKMKFDVDFGDEWKNHNSGNMVHWIAVRLDYERSNEDEVECPDCGYVMSVGYDEACNNCDHCDYELFMHGHDDNREKTPSYVVPDNVQKVYRNREFVRQVPRHVWRNG